MGFFRPSGILNRRGFFSPPTADAFVYQTAPYASTSSVSVVNPNPDFGTLVFTKAGSENYYYNYLGNNYVYYWEGVKDWNDKLVYLFLGKNTSTNTWVIFGDHESGDSWSSYEIATNNYTGNDVPLNGWTNGITITV